MKSFFTIARLGCFFLDKSIKFHSQYLNKWAVGLLIHFYLIFGFSSALSGQQILDIGIFNNPVGSDKLEIRIKPTQTVSNGSYTAGVFTVRFLSSYGITLTAPAALNNPLFRYAIANQGTDGTYSYYSLAFVTPFTVNWTAGVAYPIAVLQINSGCGSGNGTFEIINNAWTAANNGNVYQELNGTEAQNVIYQPTVTAPLGVGMMDTTPPTITCASNKTAATDFNRCYHTHVGTNWDAIGNDNCPGFIIEYFLSGATNDTLFTLDDAVFNKGLTNLSVIITDGAGLKDTCTFTVTTNDSLPPAITAPPTLVVPANAAACTASGLNLGNPVSSDNCPGVQISNNAPGIFLPGNTTVIWTATDAAGLTTTATQLVTVQSSLAANSLDLSSHLICNSDTAQLSFTLSGGPGPYTVVYSGNGIQSTATGYSSNKLIPVAPVSTTGYKLISVTDAIGCSIAPLAMVDTLIVLPKPTLSSLLPSDSTACQGDSVSFSANGLLPNVATTFNYTLSPGGSAMQTGQSSLTGTFKFDPAANAPGVYMMTIQSITVDGCTTNFSTGNSNTYIIYANPTLSGLVPSKTAACQGDSISFTAQGLLPNEATTFNYTLQPGGPASQTGTSTAGGTFTFSPAANQPGMYGMTLQSITTNGCNTNFSSNNAGSYTVKPSPTLSSLQPSALNVCLGTAVSFTANGLLPNDTNTFNFTLTPGGPASLTGISSATGTFNFSPTTNPLGLYSMSIQSISSNGCTSNFSSGNSGTYIVNPYPTIQGVTPSEPLVCVGSTVYILANGLLPDVLTTFQYTLNGIPGTETVLTNSTGTATLLSAIYQEGIYTVEITSVSIAGCAVPTNLSASFAVDPFQSMCGFTVAGRLATETNKGVEEANVKIEGLSLSVPYLFTDLTDTSGRYDFVNTIPLASSYTLTPHKDDNPLNGVTTYDLVLISKHILGTLPLDSPYKIIAADANKSNSVTTFDIVELRKLILGIYLNLPNNTSWRFIDKTYGFPTANNPFVPQFPVTISKNNILMSALNENFVAVKVGDVNGTVILNAAPVSSDKEPRSTLFINIKRVGDNHQKNELKAGEIFTLSFTPSVQIAGYQFTLDLKDLEVIDIKISEGMDEQSFAVFRDAVTSSFVSTDPAQTGAFTITFRAMGSGRLSEMLAFSSRITPAEAYSLDADMAIMELKGLFLLPIMELPAFELSQNHPNPFTGNTRIPFYLPEADLVKMTIFNAQGTLIYEQQNEFKAGSNSFFLNGNAFSDSGVLFYKVESARYAAVKKMLRQ